MPKIYYVLYSDCIPYRPYEFAIGYFSTLEKAIEAAKRYADEKFEKYEVEDASNGCKTFRSDDGHAVFIVDYELDVYLPDVRY